MTEEEGLTADEVLLRRMDAGLYTLQQCALIIGNLWIVGDQGVKQRLLMLLHQQVHPQCLLFLVCHSHRNHNNNSNDNSILGSIILSRLPAYADLGTVRAESFNLQSSAVQGMCCAMSAVICSEPFGAQSGIAYVLHDTSGKNEQGEMKVQMQASKRHSPGHSFCAPSQAHVALWLCCTVDASHFGWSVTVKPPCFW